MRRRDKANAQGCHAPPRGEVWGGGWGGGLMVRQVSLVLGVAKIASRCTSKKLIRPNAGEMLATHVKTIYPANAQARGNPT